MFDVFSPLKMSRYDLDLSQYCIVASPVAWKEGWKLIDQHEPVVGHAHHQEQEQEQRPEGEQRPGEEMQRGHRQQQVACLKGSV
jgi:hypothetical protein